MSGGDDEEQPSQPEQPLQDPRPVEPAATSAPVSEPTAPRFRVLLRKHAAKTLSKLEKKDQKKLAEVVRALGFDPMPHNHEWMTDSKDEDTGLPLHRVRCGDFRITYVIDTERGTVDVSAIGDRKEVYR